MDEPLASDLESRLGLPEDLRFLRRQISARGLAGA